jgi:hypothetical protein
VDGEADVKLTVPRLLLIILLELLVLLIAKVTLRAQEKPVPGPRPQVYCIAKNYNYDLAHYDKETKKLVPVNQDDWRVVCTITVKEKEVYKRELDLPRPTEYRDAMLAIDEFRTKKAAVILKEKK